MFVNVFSALLGQTADAPIRNAEGETDYPGPRPRFVETAHCRQLLLVAAPRGQGKAASSTSLTAGDAGGALAGHDPQPW